MVLERASSSSEISSGLYTSMRTSIHCALTTSLLAPLDSIRSTLGRPIHAWSTSAHSAASAASPEPSSHSRLGVLSVIRCSVPLVLPGAG